GVSLDAQKIDLNNSDFDNMSFLGLGGSKFLDEYACYSPAFGIPRPDSGGSCPDGTFDSATLGDEYYLDGYFLTPPASGASFMMVGGSYLTGSTYPSVYSAAFVSPSFTGAAVRCGFS